METKTCLLHLLVKQLFCIINELLLKTRYSSFKNGNNDIQIKRVEK